MGRPISKEGLAMKKNLGPMGEQYPQVVFIVGSYDEDGVGNAMNVAWGGQCTRNEIAINIGNHKTTQNILARKAFTVAPADAAHVTEADYFGIATGSKVDKEAGSGLTFVKSDFVDAPVIEEFPLTMECVVKAVQEWGGEHRIIGEIVNTQADESILNEAGRVDFDRMRPIVFDAGSVAYRVAGEVVGSAFSDGKKLI